MTRKEHERRMLGLVGQLPTTWLDSLLTGPTAVLGKPPYDCPDIERLLRAVKARVQRASVAEGHER